MTTDRLRQWLATPAAPDPPARVWRDWVVLGVVVVAMVVEASVRTGLPGRWVSLAVGLSLAPLLLVRRTRPFLAAAVPFVLGIVHSLVELVGGSIVPTLDTLAWVLLLAYSLVRWAPGRQVAAGLALFLVGSVFAVAVEGMDGVSGVESDAGDGVVVTLAEDILGAVVVLGGTIEIAFAVRGADRRRREQLADVVADERRDLARELHDTVAHHVAGIAVQAQAARAVAGADPAQALVALAQVEESASQALAEMRSLVRVLRDDDDLSRGPQPGLADLRALADATAVPAVRVEVGAGVEPLAAPVPTTLFRLAHEAVTNARRHARGARQVTVRVTDAGEQVRLRVEDDGRPSVTAGVGATIGLGYGLVGMAERARLVGGSCTAGPATDGGWAVDAVLPRDGGAA